MSGREVDALRWYTRPVRIAWATDVHLNFLDREARRDFARELVRAGPDAIVLSGDIGEATSVVAHLETLASDVERPVYFVLGNHDFYRGTIAAVRAASRELSAWSKLVRWLPAAGVLPLGEGVGLAGVDGWGDGRAGDPEGTAVRLNDFRLIQEISGLSRRELLARVRALGEQEAALTARLLDEACARFRHLLFVTHVPPFAEACWHEGRVSDDSWLPWFTCVAVGEALRERMLREPELTTTVLCGHTHGTGFAPILPNLRVYTGGAEYGAPRVAAIVEIEAGGVRVVPS